MARDHRGCGTPSHRDLHMNWILLMQLHRSESGSYHDDHGHGHGHHDGGGDGVRGCGHLQKPLKWRFVTELKLYTIVEGK